MNKRERISISFAKYLPDEFVPYVVDLFFAEQVHFRITKPRKTKLGDYRPPFNGKPHQITVNGNLNPYAFLITTLHEFAHLRTFVKYGNRVKAHGVEWKHEFKELLLPLLNSEALPTELKSVLMRSTRNLKAASCTDTQLYRALKAYDTVDDNVILLEDLGNDKVFQLGNRTFQRGILRRKRYLCAEVATGKQFLVSRLAEVKPVND